MGIKYSLESQHNKLFFKTSDEDIILANSLGVFCQNLACQKHQYLIVRFFIVIKSPMEKEVLCYEYKFLNIKFSKKKGTMLLQKL